MPHPDSRVAGPLSCVWPTQQASRGGRSVDDAGRRLREGGGGWCRCPRKRPAWGLGVSECVCVSVHKQGPGGCVGRTVGMGGVVGWRWGKRGRESPAQEAASGDGATTVASVGGRPARQTAGPLAPQKQGAGRAPLRPRGCMSQPGRGRGVPLTKRAIRTAPSPHTRGPRALPAAARLGGSNCDRSVATCGIVARTLARPAGWRVPVPLSAALGQPRDTHYAPVARQVRRDRDGGRVTRSLNKLVCNGQVLMIRQAGR